MNTRATGIEPGTVIQDTYRVDMLLGEGGMGATYKGVNLATGHDVALKVITPEFARNKKAADLFRREANLLRTVQSPAIVRYETTMIDRNGQLYLVMDYIDGKPLKHYLDKGARLAEADLLKLADRLLDGLSAIHELGIVHRDISPDNIMIPSGNIARAMLIDFGVASDSVGSEHSIIGDTFAGKISYSSPEQLGIGEGAISAATDLYAVGLVLMKTAGLAVPGAGGRLADAIDARRNDIRISDTLLKQVPGLALGKGTRQLLESLLRAAPKDRARNPRELVAKAQAEAAATAAAAKPVFEDEPLPAPARRGPPLLAIVAGVMILVSALGGAAWYFMGQRPAAPGGVAVEQAAIASGAVQAADPLAETMALINSGTSDNLNAAFGALMAIARDDARDRDLRARASLEIARMYDPATHDAARSPFPAPNPSAARRFYEQARDLGAVEAQAALDRL
jgi:predicted Ser/Thr protein kinase